MNYDNLQFPTKQRKLYFHIISIDTQGYITLNKYIMGIASKGLPKVNLWATKSVTKDCKMRQKHYFWQNTVNSEQKFTPKNKYFTQIISVHP